MEVQLFDSAGGFLFRFHPMGPLSRLFDRFLAAAAPNAELGQDAELSADQVRAGFPVLESALREELDTALAQGKGEPRTLPMEIGAVAIDVLGRRLFLDLRSDDDLTLSRINTLVSALRGITRTVRVLVVPDAPLLTRLVAAAVQHAEGPVLVTDLQAGVLEDLEPEDAELVRRRGLGLEVAHLVDLGLITETNSGQLRATSKLRTIIL
ncbi:hypothetical protein [Actinocrispum sp. NPDC049592]|uniref:hypothetical protein n=1 Tax=Actinocrispum sp. NPDC049592 TaxID=3154835 RepID=UPI003434A3F7